MARKLFVLALATVVIVGIAITTQAQEDGAIQVGVVIQGADGDPQTFCVTLDNAASTGVDALLATGLDLNMSQGISGAQVCAIGERGCGLDDTCFCQCEGGPNCAYWAYFHLSDSGFWQYSPVGAGGYALAQGAVEGWWWRESDDTSAGLPVIPFDEICAPSAMFPRVVIDGLGREVEISVPPQRIASVTLGSDEILFDLVGPARLLGVTYFAEIPSISNIAGRLDGIEHTRLDAIPEVLISLDADLVILASYSDPATLDQLLDAGVPVFVLTEFNTIDEVRANIRLLGRVTGEEARAGTLIDEMDQRIARVQERVTAQEPVRVLYYEPGGVTYGPGSTVGEIITLAGGINVVGEVDMGAYPLINAEFIISADPDVILLGTWFSEADDPLSWFTEDPAYRNLRAVRNGRVYVINDAHLTNVSHYIAAGVEDVARVLYPDVFEAES